MTAATNDPGWVRGQLQHVGVIVDAEQDPQASGILTAEIFARLNRSAPTLGGVAGGPTSRVGTYLLPDAANPGGLESLLRRAADPAIASCTDAFFACYPNPGHTTAQRDKAWVGAYLAARTGNPRVDQAWPAGFDAAHPAFMPLRAFLAALVAP